MPRKLNGLGVVGGFVGGITGSLGAALVLGFVANEIGEASRRKREQQQAREAQLFVMSAVHQVAALLGTWVPTVEFDRQCGTACQNAHWDAVRQKMCVNTTWAMQQYVASCNNQECSWHRIVFLVAHEMGHATDPLLRSGHPWRDERHADFVAGQVLGLLGIHPQNVVNELIHWPASATHPGGRERVRCLLAGYQSSTGIALAVA